MIDSTDKRIRYIYYTFDDKFTLTDWVTFQACLFPLLLHIREAQIV